MAAGRGGGGKGGFVSLMKDRQGERRSFHRGWMSSQKGWWGSYSESGADGWSSLVTRGKEEDLWGSQFQHEGF